MSDAEDLDDAPVVTHYNPTTVLVLGLLGVLCCGVLAPAAWIMGTNYLRECEALGVLPDSRGTAGRVLGIVGAAVWGVLLLLRVILCLLGTGVS